MDPADLQHRDNPEKPPVFATWGGWYALVIGTLAGVILLLYLFMKVFG